MDITNKNEKEDIQSNNLEMGLFESFESVEENKNKLKTNENINSPQLIQDILHLSSHSTQNGYQLQNNLIRSLYSFNDSITTILDDDFSEDNINFNPRIIFLKKKNKLNMMNFPQINSDNDFLLKKINQYNDLKQKISEFKSLENKDKENNNNEEEKEEENKEEYRLKLFLTNHPLINLFKDEIDILKLKDQIQNQYLKRMKDNTNYKPGPENPHLINLLEEELSENEEENDEENDIASEPSGIVLEEGEELHDSIDNIDEPIQNLLPQNNENQNNIDNLNNLAQNIEHHDQILLNDNNNQAQPNNENNINEPIEIIQNPNIALIQPIEPDPPLEPNEPLQPLEPIEPVAPIEHQQNMELVQPIEPIEHIEQNQQMEQIEPEQPIVANQILNSPPPNVLVSPIELNEFMQDFELLPPFQPVEPIQQLEPLQPSQLNPPSPLFIPSSQSLENNEINQEQTNLSAQNNNINNQIEQNNNNNNNGENMQNINIVQPNENENNEINEEPVIEENKENNE